MNKKERRLNTLIQLLQDSPRMSVKNLAQMLSVSDMTIRRDLQYLKENQLLRWNLEDYPAGNLVDYKNIEKEYSFQSDSVKYLQEKEKIGKYAASMIVPGDTLILDSGTTVAEMARYVPENQNLTVTCYNYGTLERLFRKSGIEITLSGGRLHSEDLMFESAYGNELIRNIRANKFFMATSGIHETLGLTCAHNYEVLTKRAAMESSAEVILLADSSKFGLVRTAYVTQLKDVSCIVTDSGITDEWKERIYNMGIKLEIV